MQEHVASVHRYDAFTHMITHDLFADFDELLLQWSTLRVKYVSQTQKKADVDEEDYRCVWQCVLQCLLQCQV